eukprot:Gb_24639 [translate_table: standard]
MWFSCTTDVLAFTSSRVKYSMWTKVVEGGDCTRKVYGSGERQGHINGTRTAAFLFVARPPKVRVLDSWPRKSYYITAVDGLMILFSLEGRACIVTAFFPWYCAGKPVVSAMEFARNLFSFGELPALASPRGWGETAESIDFNSIGDVFRIDDLSEFSNEDIAGPIPSRSAALSSTLSSASSENISKLAICSSFANAYVKEEEFGLCGPDEEGIGLEWLTDFAEDSYTAAAPMGSSNSGSVADSIITDMSPGESKQTVIDSQGKDNVINSAITAAGAINENSSSQKLKRAVPGRARSKRSRVRAHVIRVWSCEEVNAPAHEQAAGKIRKGGQDGSAQQPRRCTHCLSQRTPQWRAGPLGPKTLCNACGVRFKSGRLFPEYRPAKSPTYISFVHSNSHKKVLEMRSQVESPIRQPQEQLYFLSQQEEEQNQKPTLKLKIKIAGFDEFSSNEYDQRD